GEIDLRSTPGQGTTFSLRVPRTLTSTLVLVVRQNGDDMGIPADQIRDCREIQSGYLAAAQVGGKASRNTSVRKVRLDQGTIPLNAAGLLSPTPQDESGTSLALLEISTAEGPVGVLVSQVIEVASLPITPVPLMLRGLDALLGFLPSADGRARPLIDASRIVG